MGKTFKDRKNKDFGNKNQKSKPKLQPVKKEKFKKYEE